MQGFLRDGLGKMKNIQSDLNEKNSSYEALINNFVSLGLTQTSNIVIEIVEFIDEQLKLNK